jgi:hypothetical protein
MYIHCVGCSIIYVYMYVQCIYLILGCESLTTVTGSKFMNVLVTTI